MDKYINRLKAYKDAGIFLDIDLELARFLCELHTDLKQETQLAACLCSYSYRQANVCLSLADYAGRDLFPESIPGSPVVAPELDAWIKILDESPAVGKPGDFRPLILDEYGRIYLHKFWQHEQQLAKALLAMASSGVSGVDENLLQDGINRLFKIKEGETDWQAVAAALSVFNKLTILSGSPGTGKTTTIIRMLVLMLEQERRKGNKLSIALAAPTGKAAARLQESISQSKPGLNTDAEIMELIPAEATTLHQLLGARRNSSSFRYDKENPLPYDLVVVDEASMIDQTLISSLMDALLEDSRLVLVGDKDQLASVEAGSVMDDICAEGDNLIPDELARRLEKAGIHIDPSDIISSEKPLPLHGHIIELKKNYRFSAQSGIGLLTEAIKNGDSKKATELLVDSAHPDIELRDFSAYRDYEEYIFEHLLKHFKELKEAGDLEAVIEKFNRFMVLTAHRKGPRGAEYINARMEELLAERGYIASYKDWYNARPIIIGENNYALGLSNGDIGFCSMIPDEDKKVWFKTREKVLELSPARLPAYEVAYALTIHKSQGSEFKEVTVILPRQTSPILSRQLLYTAVSRAREKVTIVGNAALITHALQHPLRRSSGLKQKLWPETPAISQGY